MKRMRMVPRRILIVRTDRIGDVLLSTPVIKNVRMAYPDAYIAFLCRPYTKDIVEGNPYLDEVIIYDKYREHKRMRASIEFSYYIREKKFDWAIILHPTNRVHLITFFAKIPTRVGWNRKMGYLLTERIPHTKQRGKKHELEYTLDILRYLNIPIVDESTHFPLKKDAEEKIENMLKGMLRQEKFIVIHPSASCASKRWPQEYFVQLIQLLRKRLTAEIVLITAKGEEKFGDLLAKEGVVDLKGKLSIAQVGSLLSRSALFISNDSGPVHIAAALNTPVISIFGRKNPGLSPRRWRPLGRHSFYLHKDVGCKSCLAHNCKKGFVCLRAIKPEEVATLAERLVKG
ncbi:MAG: lipopolysaccharide heptosyltransferase II [Candidatus Omnitrophota bacterium]|nr:MAG: lipopolysaccharide heptosyltransferase II [Candidatus Omnitrophota bacterium]